MHKSLIIYNLEFAQNQLKLVDSFDVAMLPRISSTLLTHEKVSIYFELTGATKQYRQPSLQLIIKANLPVTCQRCLSDMVVNIDLHFNYLIYNQSNDAQDDDDETDWLEANHEMDLLELIEDELLLAMPIAPSHIEACSKASMQSGEKPNPFAVLKDKFKDKIK